MKKIDEMLVRLSAIATIASGVLMIFQGVQLLYIVINCVMAAFLGGVVIV